jgi:predicted esterase
MAGDASIHTIRAVTHGRYLVQEPPAGSAAGPLLVGFHGQGEAASAQLERLRAVAGDRPWRLLAIQALHRYNTRSNEVVACWMTREDRELAIADNLAYIREVVVEVRGDVRGPLVVAGFSQGVAMAYRAAAFAGVAAAGLIVLAGDLPPDVVPVASQLPPVLLGRGLHDKWYTGEKAQRDLMALRQAGVPVHEHVFDDGHLWHESFATRAGRFLDERLAAV